MTVGATIVLADDESELRTVYATCLRQEGYDVCEAADGHEAIDLIRARRPELLLLDVWMPGLNGFEVLDCLRLEPHSVRLKVVMLSGHDDADTRLESFAEGVADYWIKGLSLADLCAQVRQLLAEEKVVPD
jgi:DNA-binding response OmpR family regulator